MAPMSQRRFAMGRRIYQIRPRPASAPWGPLGEPRALAAVPFGT